MLRREGSERILISTREIIITSPLVVLLWRGVHLRQSPEYCCCRFPFKRRRGISRICIREIGATRDACISATRFDKLLVDLYTPVIY